MAHMFGNEGYYKKMLELQEKLRKSEEERLILEEKFNEMMRLTRDAEHERLRILRHKYHRFLEEDKIRQERNENILRALDRIESRAAMFAAKTDRFKALRKQYESYIKRMYLNRKPESPEQKFGQKSVPDQNYSNSNIRRRLFTDLPTPTDEGAEAKLALLEQYLHDNFQNFPSDLSPKTAKTRESVLNENRLFNRQNELSPRRLTTQNERKEPYQEQQRLRGYGKPEIIISDSRESDEYQTVSNENIKNDFPREQMHLSQSKYPYNLSEYNRSPIQQPAHETGALLGNVIEKELQRLLENKSNNSDEKNERNGVKETTPEPYVQDYKNLVLKSAEKYGLENGDSRQKTPSPNVNDSETTQQNVNIFDNTNKTISVEELKNIVNPTTNRNECVTSKANTGDEEISKDIKNKIQENPDSESENPVIKKYKEMINTLDDDDIQIMSDNKEKETHAEKLEPRKENDIVVKRQQSEITNKNSIKGKETQLAHEDDEKKQDEQENEMSETAPENSSPDKSADKSPVIKQQSQELNQETSNKPQISEEKLLQETDTKHDKPQEYQPDQETPEKILLQDTPIEENQYKTDDNQQELQQSQQQSVYQDEYDSQIYSPGQEITGEQPNYQEGYNNQNYPQQEIVEGQPKYEEGYPQPENSGEQVDYTDNQNLQADQNIDDKNYLGQQNAEQGQEKEYSTENNFEGQPDYTQPDYQQQEYNEGQQEYGEGYNDQYQQQEQYNDGQGYQENYPQQQEGYDGQNYPDQQYAEGQQYQQDFSDPNYQPQEYTEGQPEYDQQNYPENYSADQQYAPEGDYDPQNYPAGQNQSVYQSEQEYIQGEQNIDMQYQTEQFEGAENLQYQGEYPNQEYQPEYPDGFVEQAYQEGQQYTTEQQEIQQPVEETNVSGEHNVSENSENTITEQNLEPENKPLVEKKLPNLAEMLDTDTESTKQETKVSNDSDFDFSNSKA